MPLAVSRLCTRMGPSTSPTTGSLAASSRAWDRRGIRCSGVGPANSLKDYRELFSIRGCAALTGARSSRRPRAHRANLAEYYARSLSGPLT